MTDLKKLAADVRSEAYRCRPARGARLTQIADALDAVLAEQGEACGVVQTLGNGVAYGVLTEPLVDGTKLYAHPPAQPASVPDAHTGMGSTPEYIAGWNACRAAMLKGQKS